MNAKQIYAFETGSHPSDLVCCMCDKGELSDDAYLFDVFKTHESSAPCILELHSSIFATINSAECISKGTPFIEFVSGKTDALDRVVSELRCSDFEVEAVDGSGGVYFFSVPNGKNLAVFKPHDEEPNAPNNPNCHKNVFGTIGLKRGIRCVPLGPSRSSACPRLMPYPLLASRICEPRTKRRFTSAFSIF
jgi:hypothetical protein